MSIHERTGHVSVERLGPDDLVETFGFLDRDPVVNVYLVALTLRDTLGRAEDEFWAARRDGAIVGVMHVSARTGAVLPACDDPEGARRLAEQALARIERLPRRFQVIGPRGAVQAIVARLATSGIRARLQRSQAYMALERGRLPAFERLPELRAASPDDHSLVFASGCRLRLEELEEDPRAADPIGYNRRVEAECRDGSTYLWVDASGLRFRASVSAVTPDAAQVSGVYTPPERRRRGHAGRALAELCARLLERSRAACLFVNDFNRPAIELYRKLGFESRADWASAFYDPSH